jgi:hypothetical protein
MSNTGHGTKAPMKQRRWGTKVVVAVRTECIPPKPQQVHMHVFVAMAHPHQTRNRCMVTTEPEAMVNVDLLSDTDMSKPARPNLSLFERARYASCPFRSIFSMETVDQDFEAGQPLLQIDWILEE